MACPPAPDGLGPELGDLRSVVRVVRIDDGDLGAAAQNDTDLRTKCPHRTGVLCVVHHSVDWPALEVHLRAGARISAPLIRDALA